jgi:antitoxin (DNA-binding transcriptional repressor) of toxin-antitoxin stability system
MRVIVRSRGWLRRSRTGVTIIVREHHPVVKLTPLTNLPKRYPAKAGSAKGLVWMFDDFDEPLEEANHGRE